mgnify:CR=1 FL=1
MEQVKWVSIETMEDMIDDGQFVPAVSLCFDLLKELLVIK